MYSALSTLNTTTEVPLSKAPEPPTAPRAQKHKMAAHCSGCVFMVCVCSLLCVCTLDGSNAEHKLRVWVAILGRMSLHFSFFFYPLVSRRSDDSSQPINVLQ